MYRRIVVALVIFLVAFPFYAQQTERDANADGELRSLSVFASRMINAGSQTAADGSIRSLRTECFPQMDGMRVYRGAEIKDLEVSADGFESPLPAELTAHGFHVNYDHTVRIDAATGSVTVYKVEPPVREGLSTSSEAGPLPFFIVTQRTGESELTLRVDMEMEPNTNEVAVIRMSDIVSGSQVVFDIANASVSCPKTSICVVDCALKKLCSSISPCSLMLFSIKAADCFAGTKAGCIALALDLAEAVYCMGVDCALQCGQSSGCAHSECKKGVKLSKSCSSCAKKVCADDSYCCTNEWDKPCVDRAKKICGSTCK